MFLVDLFTAEAEKTSENISMSLSDISNSLDHQFRSGEIPTAALKYGQGINLTAKSADARLWLSAKNCLKLKLPLRLRQSLAFGSKHRGRLYSWWIPILCVKRKTDWTKIRMRFLSNTSDGWTSNNSPQLPFTICVYRLFDEAVSRLHRVEFNTWSIFVRFPFITHYLESSIFNLFIDYTSLHGGYL